MLLLTDTSEGADTHQMESGSQFLPQSERWDGERDAEKWRHGGNNSAFLAMCLLERMDHVTGHVALSDKAEGEKSLWRKKSETLATASQKPPREDRQRRKEGEERGEGNQESKNCMHVKKKKKKGKGRWT